MKPIKYGKLTIIGDTMINLDEVRLVNDKVVLFKDDPVRYDVGQEAADAIRDCIKQIRQACGEPQPENPDKGPARPSSDLPPRSEGSGDHQELSS